MLLSHSSTFSLVLFLCVHPGLKKILNTDCVKFDTENKREHSATIRTVSITNKWVYMHISIRTLFKKNNNILISGIYNLKRLSVKTIACADGRMKILHNLRKRLAVCLCGELYSYAMRSFADAVYHVETMWHLNRWKDNSDFIATRKNNFDFTVHGLEFTEQFRGMQ